MDVPEYCYYQMFNNYFEGYVTALTQAPELPATSLTDYCYASMFYGCTSLTQAPELLATSLANGCYSSMFKNCTSLIQAPELPATTLADYCYESMFYGCTNLNNINVSFTAWNPSDATLDWVSNVSSSGIFTCSADLPDTPRDGSHIPSGWTRADKQ